MYWFGSDRTGRRFAQALADRARAGVTVQVIYDAVGSWEADRAMFDEMRAAGCDVHEYNPIAPFRKRFNLGVANRRDHRKILVVDGTLGMTGGVNLGDEWASVESGGQGFRDDMIRIEGPAAYQLRDIFRETWVALGGREPRSDDWHPSRDGAAGGESGVRVLANFRMGAHRAIRRVYLQQIAQAKSYIYITNSYFVPDRVVRRALAKAAARGVVVKVIVPGDSDVIAVYWAGRRLYTWLVQNGVALHEWQRTVLHAKTAVVDGSWCTVGTYNLDYRSFRFNLEVTATIADEGVGAAMRLRFERDLAESVPVDLKNFSFRPLSERLLEHFFYLFRKLL